MTAKITTPPILLTSFGVFTPTVFAETVGAPKASDCQSYQEPNGPEFNDDLKNGHYGNLSGFVKTGQFPNRRGCAMPDLPPGRASTSQPFQERNRQSTEQPQHQAAPKPTRGRAWRIRASVALMRGLRGSHDRHPSFVAHLVAVSFCLRVINLVAFRPQLSLANALVNHEAKADCEKQSDKYQKPVHKPKVGILGTVFNLPALFNRLQPGSCPC